MTYLTTDHLGTPLLATDTSGATVWTGGVEPFGEAPSDADDAGVFLRFPGQWSDSSWEDTGLHYNVARWYRAGTGRYTRPDPLGISAGLNLYHYGLSNPMVYVDPDGRNPGIAMAEMLAVEEELEQSWREFDRRLTEEILPNLLVDAILSYDCAAKFANEARSIPLIKAIEKFEIDQGRPPNNLTELVPEYLPSVPGTGLRTSPSYRYLTGEEAKRHEGNAWVLEIDPPGILSTLDIFVYYPNGNYNVSTQSGSMKRIGEWAYYDY